MPWIDIFHWTTPRSGKVRARLSDRSEAVVSFNPMRQCWIDDQDRAVNPVEWWQEDEPAAGCRGQAEEDHGDAGRT